jgi:hypothetical protein
MSLPGIAYLHWWWIGQAAERIPASARVRFLPDPLDPVSVFGLQIQETGEAS